MPEAVHGRRAPPSSIIIADEVPFVCEFLSDFCRKKWPQAKIRKCSNFDATLTLLGSAPTDLLIVDYDMPSANARDSITLLLGRHAKVDTIVHSRSISASDAAFLLHKGLAACFPKDMDASALGHVLDLVAMGETYAPARLLAGAYDAAPFPQENAALDMELSPRDMVLLSEFSKGMPNKKIAEILRLSESMVKQAARALFQKLGVRTRAHAVAIAFQKGLIGAGDGP